MVSAAEKNHNVAAKAVRGGDNAVAELINKTANINISGEAPNNPVPRKQKRAQQQQRKTNNKNEGSETARGTDNTRQGQSGASGNQKK